jgi:hypothetical protein
VRGPVDDALGQPRLEARSDPLTRRQLIVHRGERASAVLTAVAALAPHQPCDPPGDRQVTHPHPRALLDEELAAAAMRAAGSASPLHIGHDKAIQPGEMGSVILHPLLLNRRRQQGCAGRRTCLWRVVRTPCLERRVWC